MKEGRFSGKKDDRQTEKVTELNVERWQVRRERMILSMILESLNWRIEI